MEKAQRSVGERFQAVGKAINQTAYDIRREGYLWRNGPTYTQEELPENRLLDTSIALGKGGLLGVVLGFAGPVFWEVVQEAMYDSSSIHTNVPEMNWMNVVIGTAVGLGVGTLASAGLAWRRGRTERLNMQT